MEQQILNSELKPPKRIPITEALEKGLIKPVDTSNPLQILKLSREISSFCLQIQEDQTLAKRDFMESPSTFLSYLIQNHKNIHLLKHHSIGSNKIVLGVFKYVYRKDITEIGTVKRSDSGYNHALDYLIQNTIQPEISKPTFLITKVPKFSEKMKDVSGWYNLNEIAIDPEIDLYSSILEVFQEELSDRILEVLTDPSNQKTVWINELLISKLYKATQNRNRNKVISIKERMQIAA
jgi:hypothetical protein